MPAPEDLSLDGTDFSFEIPVWIIPILFESMANHFY